MKKIALLLLSLLVVAQPAFAADNAVIVTPGTGVTMKSKDIGAGVQAMQPILSDTAGLPIYGVAGTANANILTVQGIASMTPLLATATQSGTWNITNISGTVSLPTGASTSANQTSTNTKLDTIITNTGAAIPAGTNTIGTVGQLPYPVGATPYTASATGTTAATTATLTGAVSVTTYICGFSIRANATAAATGNATVTGTITATLNFTQWTAPLASGLGITEMVFSPCVPASATNTSIAVVSAAPGSGGVVSVTAWGYKL